MKMKLNFSIDFILGSCGSKKADELPAAKRTRLDNDTSNSLPEQRSFTVEWRPPFRNAIKSEFEPASTHQTHDSAYRFPFMPSFVPSTSATHLLATHQHHHYQQQQQRVNSPETLSQRLDSTMTRVSRHYSPESQRGSNSRHDYSFSSSGGSPRSSSEESDADERVNSRLHNSIDEKIFSAESKATGSSSKSKSTRVGRRLFTGFQILELEKAFAAKTYLTRTERAYLAQKVDLTECQIKTWFQNRRTKEKRRGPCGSDEEPSTDDVTSVAPRQTKPVRIPGHGIQVRPTFGPPDRHLQAAIVDFLQRRSSEEIQVL